MPSDPDARAFLWYLEWKVQDEDQRAKEINALRDRFEWYQATALTACIEASLLAGWCAAQVRQANPEFTGPGFTTEGRPGRQNREFCRTIRLISETAS